MGLAYLSSPSKRISGSIKQDASDFAVEEVMENGIVLELDTPIERPDSGSAFVHFVLQKENWSTTDAVREIASRLHVSPKRINYAGTKDKRAITTQLMSAYGVKKEDVLRLKITGMKVLGAWNAAEKVDLGMLLGNRFRVKVIGEVDAGMVREIASELKTGNGEPVDDALRNCKFPNYFGPQRFGTARANTHLIGEKLVRSDLRGAVESYLMDSAGETNQYAVEARKKLTEDRDYKKALEYFPKHLRLERLMLLHLAEQPYDYANALRRLPRQVLLMFIHAFQSHLFNLMLSERLAEGELEIEEGEYYCGETHGFPNLGVKLDGERVQQTVSKAGLSTDRLRNVEDGIERTRLETGNWIAGKVIGYETELNERESELLERFNIRKEDFRIRAMPEINSKGTYRTLLAPMKDFEYKENWFAFSLPSGSYATSALREFIKDLW